MAVQDSADEEQEYQSVRDIPSERLGDFGNQLSPEEVAPVSTGDLLHERVKRVNKQTGRMALDMLSHANRPSEIEVSDAIANVHELLLFLETRVEPIAEETEE